MHTSVCWYCINLTLESTLINVPVQVQVMHVKNRVQFHVSTQVLKRLFAECDYAYVGYACDTEDWRHSITYRVLIY